MKIVKRNLLHKLLVVQFDEDSIFHDRGVLVHLKLSIGIVHEWLRSLKN